MEALYNVVNNIKALDESREFQKFMNKDNAKIYALNLNRWEQLYEQGVDSNGVPLGYYRPYTLRTKRDPNLSHITLRETGDFYESFRIKTGYGFFEIEADSKKGKDDLEDIHGQIIGLTDESQNALGEYIIENGFSEQILENILKY